MGETPWRFDSSLVYRNVGKWYVTPFGAEISGVRFLSFRQNMDQQALKSLLDQGKTTREVSSILGTSNTNIRYWMTKFGYRTLRSVRHGLKRHLTSKLEGETTSVLCCHTHGDVKHVCRVEADGSKRWRCTQCEYASVKRRRYKVKARLVQMLGGSCSRCDYSKCTRALTFHHRDRESKEFSLSEKSNWAWHRLVMEVQKCVLLCSNCHMEIEEEFDNDLDP